MEEDILNYSSTVMLRETPCSVYIYLHEAFRALRAHLLFKLWTCSFCLHFKTKKKILRIFKTKIADFQEFNFFTKLKTFKTHFFLSFINLSCGHVMSHKKFGPDQFSRFDVYWIQTNRHPNRQAKFTFTSLF